MEEMVFNSLSRYYHTLENTGYVSYNNMVKLLILIFFNDYTKYDYRGIISEKDYCLIERALYCLYGTTCLIPYPDYLKMGKLHLGEITELASRVKNLENTEVVKLMDVVEGLAPESDIQVMVDEEDTPYPTMYYGCSNIELTAPEDIAALSNTNSTTINTIQDKPYFYVAIHSSKNLTSCINTKSTEDLIALNVLQYVSTMAITTESGTQSYKVYRAYTSQEVFDDLEGLEYNLQITVE